MRPEDRYDSLFQCYAEEAGFTGSDWVKFKAQAMAESAMNPKATSGAGAKGLAQFMDSTWKEWGRGEDVFNPEAAIRAQVSYMKWLLDRVTTWRAALAAYNWGIGNVKKALAKDPWEAQLPSETRGYIAVVEDWNLKFMKRAGYVR